MKAVLGQQAWNLFGVLVFSLLSGVSQVGILFLLGPMLELLLLGQNTQTVSLQRYLPEYFTSYLEESIHLVSMDSLAMAIAILTVAFGGLRAVSSYMVSICQSAFSFHLAESYRVLLFDAVVQLKWQDFTRKGVSEWMSIIMNDVVYLQNRFVEISKTFLKEGVTLCASFVVVLMLQWQMALGLLAVLPFALIFLGKKGGRIASYASRWQQELARLSQKVLDLRRRYMFIKSQRTEGLELEKFQELNLGYLAMIKRSILLRASFSPVLEFFGIGVFAGMMYLVSTGDGVTIGKLVQVAAAMGAMIRPVKDLGEQLALWHETKGALSHTFDLLRLRQEYGNVEPGAFVPGSRAGLHDGDMKANTCPAERRPDGIKPKSICWPITIQSFGRGGDGVTIDSAPGKAITIRQGETIAIIGSSGAGKTSLLRVLLNIFPQDSWQGNLSQTQLSEHIAYLTQKPFLFKGTLWDNLLVGCPEVLSDERLYTVLEQVKMDQTVRDKGGLRVMFDPLKSQFSGGQLQRLAIARAICQQREIVAFDEPTSALDHAVEKEVMELLLALAKKEGKALLVVTHNLEYLDCFDKVWLMDANRLVFQGSPHELKLSGRHIFSGLQPALV